MASRLHRSIGGQDRTVAMLVYGLYLFGLINGLTILIGLVLAYLNLGRADPTLKSHHILQVRTVWIAAFWFVVAGALIVWSAAGASGSMSGALVLTGWLICGSTWLWFAVRSVAGLLYLWRNQPYPRPRSWFI